MLIDLMVGVVTIEILYEPGKPYVHVVLLIRLLYIFDRE